jgi:hypothetical protein
MYSLSSISL